MLHQWEHAVVLGVVGDRKKIKGSTEPDGLTGFIGHRQAHGESVSRPRIHTRAEGKGICGDVRVQVGVAPQQLSLTLGHHRAVFRGGRSFPGLFTGPGAGGAPQAEAQEDSQAHRCRELAYDAWQIVGTVDRGRVTKFQRHFPGPPQPQPGWPAPRAPWPRPDPVAAVRRTPACPRHNVQW